MIAVERSFMAGKLKTYQTSLGFFDLAIAAPSMKAALEAWGADSNLFHQGVAKESDDPDVVSATMAKPGVILRRPVGSDGPFREHADLPRLSGNESGVDVDLRGERRRCGFDEERRAGESRRCRLDFVVSSARARAEGVENLCATLRVRVDSR